jgi:hypothetical protein
MTRSPARPASRALPRLAHRDEHELVSGSERGKHSLDPPILFFRSWLKITSSNPTLHLSDTMNKA